MAKVRIYELAKETGLSNPDVMRRLIDLGVDVRSHSSTVSEGDAQTFRESLGKARAARQRDNEERARREAEEYDLAALSSQPAQRTANRILPPSMREAREAAASAPAAPAAPPRFRPPAGPAFRPGDSAGGYSTAEEPAAPAPTAAPPAPDRVAPADVRGTTAAPAPAAPVEQQQTFSPDEQSFSPDVRATEPARAAEAARAGVVRPAPRPGEDLAAQPLAPAARQGAPGEPEVPLGIPGVPRPGTPPRPGQPSAFRPQSPGATGMPVTPQRRVEHELPREGSGRRAIPPPLRAAPPGAGPGDRGRPGGPGAPGRPSSAPGRGVPVGARPGGGPGAPRGGPGGPPGPGAPGPGAPGRGRPGAPAGPGGKKGKKGRGGRDAFAEEEFSGRGGPRGRRQRGPVKATVTGPVDVLPGATVSEFAKAIGVNPTDVVGVLFRMGELATVTQSLSQDLIELVAAEMEADVRFVTPEELEFGVEAEDDPALLQPRAPVVTVMGHVDHGKTLLLDTIRKADVVSGEAGGITQHIGAYQVTRDDRHITFIDTPGHEAFTAMRARGAGVTDVVILVVAADDGVKPQTVEAINHAKAAEVPIIVAVNKIDKEGADPVRVRTQLTEYDLVAEEFGGQTTFVDVSARTGQNIDDLLEMVLLQSDVAELVANPDRTARGAVIEANLDRGRGAVATVLVQHGTLHVGDVVVAGTADGKVRAMFDDDGRAIKVAGPSTPVQVLGWNDVPDAGDEFRVVADERTAREIASSRAARERRMEIAERPRFTLENLSAAVAEGEVATLNLVIKGDVAGTVEAVASEMAKLDIAGVKTRIVHKGVGAVTQQDVNLATTAGAIIIAFNVRPEANARQAIEESGVDLRQYSVIYKAVEDIQAAVKGLLAPEFEEVVTGRGQVREVFRVPRVGPVFGTYVTDGQLRRNSRLRVVRDSVVVADDTLVSLRRFKDDVTEVASGYECGIGLANFQDVKVDDEFEAYEERQIQR